MPLMGFASFRQIVLPAALAGATAAMETTAIVPLILQAKEFGQKEPAESLQGAGHERGTMSRLNPCETGEARQSEYVVIGRNLDQAAFAAGFAKCVAA
jgi:predicted cobalt transporter CbtA